MKRNSISKVIALILILTAVGTLTLGLTGCGKKAPANLEEYVASEEGGSDLLSNIVKDDPNAVVTIEENTMVFTYTVEDPAVTEEMLTNALGSLGDTFSGIIKDLETRTGLEGITVRVSYVDGSGNEITGKIFE